MQRKPKKCTYPDCFQCGYPDCRWSGTSEAKEAAGPSYYERHREEILRKQKETYDKEKNAERCRRYRESHLEERKEYDRKRYWENPEKFRQLSNLRRLRKKEGGETFVQKTGKVCTP